MKYVVIGKVNYQDKELSAGGIINAKNRDDAEARSPLDVEIVFTLKEAKAFVKMLETIMEEEK